MTKSIDALINQALAIENEQAQEVGALGFMARAMVQATLPHRKVEGTFFERKNGNFTLSMQAHPSIGLPYGSVPRLLLDIAGKPKSLVVINRAPTQGSRHEVARNELVRLVQSAESSQDNRVIDSGID